MALCWLQAGYRVSVFVANETLGNPKIVTMSANMTVTGQVGRRDVLKKRFLLGCLSSYSCGVKGEAFCFRCAASTLFSIQLWCGMLLLEMLAVGKANPMRKAPGLWPSS